MPNEEIIGRIHRIYSALGEVETKLDLALIKPKPIGIPGKIGIVIDFQGEYTDAQITNIAYNLIHNIANLRDNLKRWAKNNKRDVTLVDSTFNNSMPLKIIQDLSNADKHGYPPGKSNSGKSPKISEIMSVLHMRAGAESNSSVTFGLNLQTQQPFVSQRGDVSTKIIITGVVTDNNDKVIGDLYQIQNDALKSWELLLNEFGLTNG